MRGTKYENRLACTWEICSWHKRILYLGGGKLYLAAKDVAFVLLLWIFFKKSMQSEVLGLAIHIIYVGKLGSGIVYYPGS